MSKQAEIWRNWGTVIALVCGNIFQDKVVDCFMRLIGPTVRAARDLRGKSRTQLMQKIAARFGFRQKESTAIPKSHDGTLSFKDF